MFLALVLAGVLLLSYWSSQVQDLEVGSPRSAVALHLLLLVLNYK